MIDICKICGEPIKAKDKITIKGLGKTHIVCYKDRLTQKYGEEYAKDKINEILDLKKKANEEKRKKNLKDKVTKEKEKQDKLNFENYITETYDITISKQLFIKFASINNGTYKGLKEPISYEDLLAMFKTKQIYLRKLHQDMIRKGKEFSNNYNMFSYDLAVIINKYDAYKSWKEKQKLNSINEEDMKKVNDNINIIIKDKFNNEDNEHEEDIGDLLSEIF